MIEKIHLRYFKKFEHQSFDLKDYVVLAGPNNAGKTTLIQAIATWHFALQEWVKKKGDSSASKRTSVALTRKEFMSVPVQRFNLLWMDSSAALRKNEGGGKGAATPRIMEITLEGGQKTGEPWKHTMEFRYANSELIYARPTDTLDVPISEVVYVPSFSGIETEEKVHTPEYQKWLIGQGKPGDIIRNLLVDVSTKESAWKELSDSIEEIFGYRLLKPTYTGHPFILCEYLPGIPKTGTYGGYPKLELASAGSGFLQTLLLLSFFYARPSTVLLVDEPDAHMHVVLQKQIYDHLRAIARNRNCQLIMATHSEVIIDNTPPEKIISFYNKPRSLLRDADRDQVREALKRLTSMDIVLARRGTILYVEDHSDFNILRAWVEVLGHRLVEWFKDPFYFPLHGSSSKLAREHFFALRATNKNISGVLLLDSNDKNISEMETTKDGLTTLRWQRYEIENYLIHPATIKSFIEAEDTLPLLRNAALEEMHSLLPPAVLKSPLEAHDYLEKTAASKSILPKILEKLDPEPSKGEYYRIAEQMKAEQIHPEVKQKLDAIANQFNID